VGFLRFYGSLVIEAIKVLISSIYWWVSTLSVLSFFAGILASLNPGVVQKVKTVWQGFASWYLLLPVIILFVHGLMRANYERFTTLEDRPDQTHAVPHLGDLRVEVLWPILEYLDGHILPVLDRRCGNVILLRQRLPAPSATFMEEPAAFAEEFGLGTAAEPPIDVVTYPGSDTLPEPIHGGALYLDARENHFPDLIRSWEHLIAIFGRYNDACLDYAKHLRADLQPRRECLLSFQSRFSMPP
jgi:hypothetical protein